MNTHPQSDKSDAIGISPKPQTAAEKRYEQICASVRTTDEISFKLLGLVPLLSGGVIAVVLEGRVSSTPLLWFLSAFGSVVTFGLFRWELRNIQTCKWLASRGAEIETKEFGLERGQFASWSTEEAPKFIRWRVGKTEAEKIIYLATIIAWLALPWTACVSKHAPEPAPKPPESQVGSAPAARK